VLAKQGRSWYQFQTKEFHCLFSIHQTISTNNLNEGQTIESLTIVCHHRKFQDRPLLLTNNSSIPPRCQLVGFQRFQLSETIITNELLRIMIILQNTNSTVKIIHSLTSHLQNVWSFRQESTKATVDVASNQVVHPPLLHVIHSFILLPPS
jgi:hypothetical protein